jgi:hypothetical protein
VNQVAAYLPVAAGLLGVLIGGILTHLLSTRRDIAVKRRELILTNLILALEEMDRSSSDRPGTELKMLEKAISRVQMFGERALVDMANKIVLELTSTTKANLTPLHLALRDKIRGELKLEPLPYGYLSLVIRYPGDKGFAEEKAKREAGGNVTPKQG